jgi:opacity protein-like surface antigen
MKFLVWIFLCAAVALISTPARAQDQTNSDEGIYFSFGLGGSDGTFNNTSWSTPTLGLEFHSTYSLAGLAAVGYQWRPSGYSSGFRLELEGSYRRNLLTAYTDAGVDLTAEGYLENIGVMTNGYVDFNIGDSVTAYIGSGVGVVRATRRDMVLNGIPIPGKFTHTPAWQYMFGFGYKLSPGVIVGLEYRDLMPSEFTWPNASVPIADNVIEFKEILFTLRLVG